MLYNANEHEIMQSALQPNMRNPKISVLPFKAIIDDYFSDEKILLNKSILDIGPGQCDFLDIVKQRGGLTYGVDFDPAIAKLGNLRGHEIVTHNLTSGWPFQGRKFDGIFCRGSLNCYWFASNANNLRAFLDDLIQSLNSDGWLWIVPWNNPSDSDDMNMKVSEIINDWMVNNGIERISPSLEKIKVYSIGYGIPVIEIWTRNCMIIGENL